MSAPDDDRWLDSFRPEIRKMALEDPLFKQMLGRTTAGAGAKLGVAWSDFTAELRKPFEELVARISRRLGASKDGSSSGGGCGGVQDG